MSCAKPYSRRNSRSNSVAGEPRAQHAQSDQGRTEGTCIRSGHGVQIGGITGAVHCLTTVPQYTTSNLESSRERSWHVLTTWFDRRGTVERIVEEEQHLIQYLGDATALDRLVTLSSSLCGNCSHSVECQVIAAQLASMRRCFSDAKMHLRSSRALGASVERCKRMWLAIKQATGEDLEATLAERLEKQQYCRGHHRDCDSEMSSNPRSETP